MLSGGAATDKGKQKNLRPYKYAKEMSFLDRLREPDHQDSNLTMPLSFSQESNELSQSSTQDAGSCLESHDGDEDSDEEMKTQTAMDFSMECQDEYDRQKALEVLRKLDEKKSPFCNGETVVKKPFSKKPLSQIQVRIQEGQLLSQYDTFLKS